MDHKMITTAFDLAGYKVTENLGIARGITVRSRDLFSDIGAGLKSLIGGKIGGYVKLCEETREEAFAEMIKHAEEIGADAIIGFHFDANEVGQGITEVLAYGTAVRIQKSF